MFNAYTFSFFGGLAAVAAIIWGSNTIKTLCSYGSGPESLHRLYGLRGRCHCDAHREQGLLDYAPILVVMSQPSSG